MFLRKHLKLLVHNEGNKIYAQKNMFMKTDRKCISRYVPNFLERLEKKRNGLIIHVKEHM